MSRRAVTYPTFRDFIGLVKLAESTSEKEVDEENIFTGQGWPCTIVESLGGVGRWQSGICKLHDRALTLEHNPLASQVWLFAVCARVFGIVFATHNR